MITYPCRSQVVVISEWQKPTVLYDLSRALSPMLYPARRDWRVLARIHPICDIYSLSRNNTNHCVRHSEKKNHMIASTIRGVAPKDTPHILILNSNLTKCRLFITYFAVVKSFWNFAQSMTISLSCSGKMSKWFVRKECHGRTRFPRDLSLRWVSRGYLVLQQPRCDFQLVKKWHARHVADKRRLLLSHWDRDEMDNISQTTFWDVFYFLKMFEFRLKFYWSLFQRV